MRKHGLNKIPSRKFDKSRAGSLLSKSNRTMGNWMPHTEDFTAMEKKNYACSNSPGRGIIIDDQ